MPRPALAPAPLLLVLLLLLAAAATPPPPPPPAAVHDFNYKLTDAQYYEMPQLFHLDEYQGCTARGQLYCVGSFRLSPAQPAALPLFDRMQIVSPASRWHPSLRLQFSTQELSFPIDSPFFGRCDQATATYIFAASPRYSNNWVDNFNHTRLHRGLCVSRRCPLDEGAGTAAAAGAEEQFASCVNSSLQLQYGLEARLERLAYCSRGAPVPAPPRAVDRALAALLAALLVLAALSTTLDLTLPGHTKKGLSWALAWSLPGCWRELVAPPRGSPELRIFDGVRVVCMMCVIMEHVCYLSTLSYVGDPRFTETRRRDPDVMLLTNSTLVVQLFFLMSSFLLAHKLHKRPPPGGGCGKLRYFLDTMLNRIIRISPSYWVVVWWAGSWWARMSDGPLWTPLVAEESAICRRKWWTHLLYANNLVYPDDKCLIQTWYLAADMQLYLASLLLLLLVPRAVLGRLLAALLGATLALLLVLAWLWRLLPTFHMHRPECVQVAYRGDASFNVLYQSPLGNAPGALAGLLLAHLHHTLTDQPLSPNQYKWFRWVSLASFPLGALWAATAPLLLGNGPPLRLPAAALAALERPVFAALMSTALLGTMHGVRSPWQSLLSWRGWAVWSRLSFAALLLHMPLNKSLLAARLLPAQLDRITAVFQWAGVAGVSYLAALPLALLLELPAQRLLQALRQPAPRPTPAPAVEHAPPQHKSLH